MKTNNPFIAAVCDQAGEVCELVAPERESQLGAPLFWVRLLHDGLYEGPVHNNSVLGKMMRDKKPEQWHALYLKQMPPQPGYTVVPIGDLKELHDSIHGNCVMGEEWEKKCISSMMPKEQK